MLRRRPPRSGYALVAVLIVVVVLSLAAYRFVDAMTAEYQVAVRTSEAAQTKAFAASGIHYAMGMVSDPETFTTRLAGNPYDNSSEFSNVLLGAADDPRAGRFSLMAVADTGVGTGADRYQVRYGVLDESAKLNLNALIQLDQSGQVLYDALMKLPGMTEDVADAVVDWLDPDDEARPAGAESSYYQGLTAPYLAKNGPLNSVEELLLVRGVTPYVLFGNDRNRNGRLDPGEEDGSGFSRGWADFVTCYGRELNADSAGNARINLGDTDLQAMSEKLTAAVGQEMSDFILAAKLYGTSSTQTRTTSTTATTATAGGGTVVAVRVTTTGQQSGSNTVQGGPNELRAAVQQSLSSGAQGRSRLRSVLALVNTQVTLPRPPDAPQDAPTTVVRSPLNDTARLKELLPALLDATTTRTEFELVPRVNVNTAPPEVLAALPGLTAEDVDAILAARGSLDPTDLATTTAAWLVTEADITPQTFRGLERYVTGQTMTYRAHAVGYAAPGGPTARVEAVIDTNQGHPRILYYRDLTDLGKGFDLPQ